MSSSTRSSFAVSMLAASAAALIALTCTAAVAQPAAAAVVCTKADNLGIERCRAGLDPQQMQQLLRTQEESQWCWAASIAMVFAGAGHEVAQETVVQQNFGELLNWPAPGGDITRLLNRRWEDREGRAFVALAQATEFGADLGRDMRQVLAELQAGRPLILGAMQHAVVLAQVEFERSTRDGGVRLVGGLVLDPKAGEGVRSMSDNEMKPSYVARIRIEAGENTLPMTAMLPADQPRGIDEFGGRSR